MQAVCEGSNGWERVSPFPPGSTPPPEGRAANARGGGLGGGVLAVERVAGLGIAFQVDGYKLSAWNCRSRPRFLCWLIDSPRRAI